MKINRSLKDAIHDWDTWSEQERNDFFTKFYLEHYHKTIRWLYLHRGIPLEEAQDLYQKGVAELLMRLKNLSEPVKDPAAYLFTVIRNAAAAKNRKENQLDDTKLVSDLSPSELRKLGLYCSLEEKDGGIIIYTADGGAIREEDSEHIVWAVLKRPEMEHCRKLLRARYLGSEKLSNTELAEELGYQDANSFNTALHKCKIRFKKILKQIYNFPIE